VGEPARPGMRATRSQAGLKSFSPVHVDIGGCGRYTHSDDRSISGFLNAININDARTNLHSYPVAEERIPALVLVNAWSTNPEYPLADGFADYVTMQSTPLYSNYVPEIARIL
jgi:hypothetical protein